MEGTSDLRRKGKSQMYLVYVGYDSINIDYHVRTQSIIIMEKI